MQVEDFKQQPTKRNHKVYEKSIFTTVAPEYSTGEVLLGSAYRMLLLGMRDAEVDLDEIDQVPVMVSQVLGMPDLWDSLILEPGGIASPPPRRSPRRQLMPLVPQVARHACVLGGMRSRWYPASLLLHVVGAGLGKQGGKELINQLGDALAVNDMDDIFGRFIEQALGAAYPPGTQPPYPSLELGEESLRAFRGQSSSGPASSPAERFCRDLGAVIGLKGQLTRRQWTVLVEAILRLGLALHVLWVCRVNDKCWELVLSVAAGATAPTAAEIDHHLWGSHGSVNSLLEVGLDARPRIHQLIEKYVAGRFGLNLLLYRLDDVGVPWSENQIIGFSPARAPTAPAAISAFLSHVASHRSDISSSDPRGWLQTNCSELMDENTLLVQSHAGFTKNMVEFVRHSLGQIDTGDPEQVSYDQAYLLSIPGKGRAKRWIIQPGPAMLILLVHACCQDQGKMPASLEDFRLHLADYGLHAPAGELLRGQVGADLERLGLVVDSPDAAGGRLLVPPFHAQSDNPTSSD